MCFLSALPAYFALDASKYSTLSECASPACRDAHSVTSHGIFSALLVLQCCSSQDDGFPATHMLDVAGGERGEDRGGGGRTKGGGPGAGGQSDVNGVDVC